MKKPQPTPSSDTSSLQAPEEDTNPGLSTQSALDLGHDAEKALILDVLQYMKKQNVQQRDNNKSQHETNGRVAFVSKLMVVGCIMGALMVTEGVVSQFQSRSALKELQVISRDYKQLLADFETLKDDVAKKLETTPEDVSRQITKLEQKVDDAPKLTADEKTGELKLEVAVSPSKPSEPAAPKAAGSSLGKVGTMGHAGARVKEPEGKMGSPKDPLGDAPPVPKATITLPAPKHLELKK